MGFVYFVLLSVDIVIMYEIDQWNISTFVSINEGTRWIDPFDWIVVWSRIVVF